MPVYNFSKPEDVAKYLKTLRKELGINEWKRFEKEKGNEFMDEVKTLFAAKK